MYRSHYSSRKQETSVEARLEGSPDRRVGYHRLTSFTDRTQPDVAAAVKRLQVYQRQPKTDNHHSLSSTLAFLVGAPMGRTGVFGPCTHNP